MAVIELERPAVRSTVPRGGRTLEDVISGAWEDLATQRVATCPICAGEMLPRFGSGPAAVGGRCSDCGGELG